MTLQQIAQAIAANADAVHAKRIDWATFTAENRRLWGLADLGELCIIGTRAAKRCAAVNRYLRAIKGGA